MKLLIALIVLTVSASVFADTFKVGPDCLAKVTKANEAIGASYLSKNSPGKVSVSIDKLATLKTDDGEAVLNGKISIRYYGDVLKIDSVNTIFPVDGGCYIENVSLSK